MMRHLSFEGRAGRLKSGRLGASRRRRAYARPIAGLWVSAAPLFSPGNLFQPLDIQQNRPPLMIAR